MASRSGTRTGGKAVREIGHKRSGFEYARPRGVEALGTAAACIALGVALPFFMHPIGISPRVALPMHFSVLLAGILLSPLHAAAVGVFTPALSMGLTGMPTPDQVLRMMPELAAYALVTSILTMLIPRIPGLPVKIGRIAAIGLALLIAMIAGRVVYVLASALMAGFQHFNYYYGVLVLPALPGIVIQLILIPPLAYKLQTVLAKS